MRVATEFLADFYGRTTASLHHGLPTDRLLVRWDLNAPRVRELVSDGEPPRTRADARCPRINDVKWQAGWPVSSEPRLELDQPELLLEIPPEWDVLCQAAPRDGGGLAVEGADARSRATSGAATWPPTSRPTEEGGRRRPLYLLRKA